LLQFLVTRCLGSMVASDLLVVRIFNHGPGPHERWQSKQSTRQTRAYGRHRAHNACVRPHCYFILPSVRGNHTAYHVGVYIRLIIVCRGDLYRVAYAGCQHTAETLPYSEAPLPCLHLLPTAEPLFSVVNGPYLCGSRSTYPNKLG
jgi:hypothetical protein